MQVLIPMAGRGSRFLNEKDRNPEYNKPKPLINIAGHMMIEWALSSLPLTKEDTLIFLVLKEHVDNSHIDQKLKEKFGENIKIVVVDKVTEGAACTALLAEKYIDNEEPMILTDSDHYLDGEQIFKDLKELNCDGLIPVFYATGTKWSFSKTNEDGKVIEVAEKRPISTNANIGAYYFSKGKDFVSAAKEMIAAEDRTNGEFYVAPVYNYLIKKGKNIRLSRPSFVYGLGTPKDLENFLDLLKKGEIKHKFDDLIL